MPELNTLQSYLKMFSFPFWWYLSKLYIKLSRVSNASQLPHVRLNVTYWAAASCLCGGGECTLLSSVYLWALCGGSKPRSSPAPPAPCAPAARCLFFAVVLRRTSRLPVGAGAAAVTVGNGPLFVGSWQRFFGKCDYLGGPCSISSLPKACLPQRAGG